MGAVGNAISNIADKVKDKIEDIKWGIESFFSTPSSSYTPSSSATSTTKSRANELAEFKKQQRKISEKTEEEIADAIASSSETFIQYIEKVNERSFNGFALNLNIPEIKKENEKLKNSIKGTVAAQMDSRLVESDPDLSEIFDISDDKKRKKEFDAFCKQVKKESGIILRNKIERTVNTQNASIRKKIQSRIDTVKELADNSTYELQKLQAEKEKGDQKVSSVKYDLMYISELCSILMDINKEEA